MTSPAERIARQAAQRLAQEMDNLMLPAEVEHQIETGGDTRPPESYLEPLTVSLGALIVTIASLAWTIYGDLRRQTPKPSAEVISRMLRVNIELPERVTVSQRDRNIGVVVEETPERSNRAQ